MKKLENLEIPFIGENTLELAEIFDTIEEDPLSPHATMVKTGYSGVKCIHCGSLISYGNVHQICDFCIEDY